MYEEVVEAEDCPVGSAPSSASVKNVHGAWGGRSGCVQLNPKSLLSTKVSVSGTKAEESSG